MALLQQQLEHPCEVCFSSVDGELSVSLHCVFVALVKVHDRVLREKVLCSEAGLTEIVCEGGESHVQGQQ